MAALPAGFDPENADNLEDIEKQWAVKAVEQMTVYWRLLEHVPASTLRLTKVEDDIYDHFKREFPEVDVSNISEDDMKSKEGKEKWRKFIAEYEKKVPDFNFGTMLRRSPKTDYEKDDTIFVVRMQFYAIEIARNRLGLNDWIHEKAVEEGTVKAIKKDDGKS